MRGSAVGTSDDGSDTIYVAWYRGNGMQGQGAGLSGINSDNLKLTHRYKLLGMINKNSYLLFIYTLLLLVTLNAAAQNEQKPTWHLVSIHEDGSKASYHEDGLGAIITKTGS